MYLTVGGRVSSPADGTAKLMSSEERMPGILSADKSFVGGAGGMLCDRRQYEIRKKRGAGLYNGAEMAQQSK